MSMLADFWLQWWWWWLRTVDIWRNMSFVYIFLQFRCPYFSVSVTGKRNYILNPSFKALIGSVVSPSRDTTISEQLVVSVNTLGGIMLRGLEPGSFQVAVNTLNMFTNITFKSYHLKWQISKMLLKVSYLWAIRRVYSLKYCVRCNCAKTSKVLFLFICHFKYSVFHFAFVKLLLVHCDAIPHSVLRLYSGIGWKWIEWGVLYNM